uniref:Mitogen-activated protein kinase kinase kinase n=2 Tax=Bactrocera dorsalis TaxID=27457 RepID=A0A034V6R1_BACDO
MVRSQEDGLNLPARYPCSPVTLLQYQFVPAPDYPSSDQSDTDTEPPTPTVSCFPFRKVSPVAQQPPLPYAYHDRSPLSEHAISGFSSLGNSPAVGRKKLSLDSELLAIERQQKHAQRQAKMLPIVMLLSDFDKHAPPSIHHASNASSATNLINEPNDPTYDRAFYREIQKSLEEIFSLPAPASRFGSQRSERLNSKSSGDLTKYNSTSQLTEDGADDESTYRFQRNASGSQFPRQCFFRQPSNAGEAADDDGPGTNASHNASFRSYSGDEHFNSICSDQSSSIDTTNSTQTSRKSSVTFQLNSSASQTNSCNSNDEQANSTIASANQSYSFSTTFNSTDNDTTHFRTDKTEQFANSGGTTSPHAAATSATAMPKGSLLHDLKLQDVQPAPEVLRMKQSLLLAQEAKARKHKMHTKKVSGKAKEPGATTTASVSFQHKVQNLLNYFTIRKKKSESEYKLFENANSEFVHEARVKAKAKAKSCEQL